MMGGNPYGEESRRWRDDDGFKHSGIPLAPPGEGSSPFFKKSGLIRPVFRCGCWGSENRDIIKNVLLTTFDL